MVQHGNVWCSEAGGDAPGENQKSEELISQRGKEQATDSQHNSDRLLGSTSTGANISMFHD